MQSSLPSSGVIGNVLNLNSSLRSGRLPLAATLAALLWVPMGARASVPSTSTSSSAAPHALQGVSSVSASEAKKSDSSSGPQGVSRYLGLNYFTFFDGPGFNGDLTRTPNNLGRPADRGLSFWTNLSARGKFSDRLALDVQFRLQQIVTNGFQFRYQGARVGVSGLLLKVERPSYTLTWTGAVNTDLPGVGGQIVSERALIANPGLFSNLTLRPTGSRFSLYALVSPRVWFYSDRDAMDFQSLEGGAVPGQKPEVAFNVQPSLNYDLTEQAAVRAGVTLDIRKNVNDSGLRRWFWPVDLGVSYSFSPLVSVYPHVRFSGPWDDALRKSLGAAETVTWAQTASVGLWVNGTLF